MRQPGNQTNERVVYYENASPKTIRNMRTRNKNVFPIMLAVVFLLSACASGYKARETATQEWLSTAKRPVKVTKHNAHQHITATRGSHFYTLIDSDGKVFLAKNVRFELPEVIE
jgi:hypothetical protein